MFVKKNRYKHRPIAVRIVVREVICSFVFAKKNCSVYFVTYFVSSNRQAYFLRIPHEICNVPLPHPVIWNASLQYFVKYYCLKVGMLTCLMHKWSGCRKNGTIIHWRKKLWGRSWGKIKMGSLNRPLPFPSYSLI